MIPEFAAVGAAVTVVGSTVVMTTGTKNSK